MDEDGGGRKAVSTAMSQYALLKMKRIGRDDGNTKKRDERRKKNRENTRKHTKIKQNEKQKNKPTESGESH